MKALGLFNIGTSLGEAITDGKVGFRGKALSACVGELLPEESKEKVRGRLAVAGDPRCEGITTLGLGGEPALKVPREASPGGTGLRAQPETTNSSNSLINKLLSVSIMEYSSS